MFQVNKPVYQIGVDDGGGGRGNVFTGDHFLASVSQAKVKSTVIKFDDKNAYWTYSSAPLYFSFDKSGPTPVVEEGTVTQIRINELLVNLLATARGMLVIGIKVDGNSGDLHQLVIPVVHPVTQYLKVATFTDLSYFAK